MRFSNMRCILLLLITASFASGCAALREKRRKNEKLHPSSYLEAKIIFQWQDSLTNDIHARVQVRNKAKFTSYSYLSLVTSIQNEKGDTICTAFFDEMGGVDAKGMKIFDRVMDCPGKNLVMKVSEITGRPVRKE